ncbi:MAG: 4Fe-4S cluster-binding domain-containing protein [Ruminococcaceae bacterium]|jgi:putative pyruvate formate lyase activating enzyme|nr:4Fe-4S cluster-binding domain-containing protein [Oscillospiraceae bacterium]
MEIKACRLCPRECGANRSKGLGACGGGSFVKVARAALHQWEEPCISGSNGSGTVFFSGCPLRCCFCQNYQLSAQNFGKEITTQRLADIFLELQDQGAHNINLVNSTHYVPWVIEALGIVKHRLHLPVVYNSGGYERCETLRMLDGLVDIYLPDLKFAESDRSKRYAEAPDYFDVATSAILEMYRQVGKIAFDQDGLLKKGLIIRHLVLPKGRFDSVAVLTWIAQNLPKEKVLLSLMSQFTPFYRCAEFPEINRRISTFEYNYVLSKAQELGLKGYMQEKNSAKEEYTPLFDLSGV